MRRRAAAARAVPARRAICIGWLLGLALFFCAVRGFAQANDAPRVAAIDWGQAQTLIAIGAPPARAETAPRPARHTSEAAATTGMAFSGETTTAAASGSAALNQ